MLQKRQHVLFVAEAVCTTVNKLIPLPCLDSKTIENCPIKKIVLLTYRATCGSTELCVLACGGYML